MVGQSGAIIGIRPNLAQALGSKGFWDQNDPTWTSWVSIFAARRNTHIVGVTEESFLQASCPKSPPGFPSGYCLHELAPPLKHGNLRWFSNRVGAISDNIQTRADGSVGVDPSSKPVWNFTINAAGEIVTGSEDFEQIKHTCLAAGADVWSAGQIGIEGDS